MDIQEQDNNPMLVQNESQARAVMEVQGQIISAKKFPRDINASIQRIEQACKRPRLANDAMYLYPRGGTSVSGPSIRLAETIAQCWGNLDYGIQEISREKEKSYMESYCYDLETNVRASRKFWVEHEIALKGGKKKKLTDQRDIYEIGANYGARRLRACILEIIPKDITDEAVDMCNRTLSQAQKGEAQQTVEDRVRVLSKAFKSIGVTIEMLERKLEHPLSEIDINEVVELGKIYNSIKDGVSKRQDWFEFTRIDESTTEDFNELIKKK